MGFVNKVMLMGNTTRDAELRTLPSGTTVCDFGLATNRVYKTTTGEEKQETVFVDCTAFGRTAEVIAEYCPKGRSLFVEGRLHFNTWEDQSGNKRSKLSVIVENFQFIGAREGGQRELPLEANGPRAGQAVKANVAPEKVAERRGTERREPVGVGAGERSRQAAPKPTKLRANLGAAGGKQAERLADAKAVDRMAEESEHAGGEVDLPF